LTLRSTYHELLLEDGDRLSVLDSVPSQWKPGDPVAVLVHGLTGCARSPYVARVADRLVSLGVRAVRMNLRGAGSGFGAARGIYHAGRTDDVRRVAEWATSQAKGSPLALMGFSLGANLVLKLAAEAVERPLEGLDCVLAANPPADLAVCCRAMQKRRNWIYDRNFLSALRVEIRRLHALFPDLGPVNYDRLRSVYDFDEHYTAPRNGFAGAEDYYSQSSCAPAIERIEVPGLVIHSLDDPFIPSEVFDGIRFPSSLALELIVSGGHLGYLSRASWGGDHRWLDARLVAWLMGRWGANIAAPFGVESGRFPEVHATRGGPVDVRSQVQ
ncbi:MAG TPA: alpha/beta fold hydrolase, partial [Isosphaeraceae bacterium]|nr:alpha/beta fold hydrolase [Isosphaeraceae bacterium]